MHDDLPALVKSMQPKLGELAKAALGMVASIGGGNLRCRRRHRALCRPVSATDAAVASGFVGQNGPNGPNGPPCALRHCPQWHSCTGASGPVTS